MRQSRIFVKTLREDPKDEVSVNARLLIRAGFVDKVMAGVYTYLPLGLRVLKKIEEIIRAEMIKAGGQEVLMPVFHPKENWEKTGRWQTYDTLFKFTSFYSKSEFVLGPTHEEIVAPLVAQFSLSYKDLPLYLFQIQTKFRDEKRVKSGMLRGREFIMKDLYSFHADKKDLEQYYDQMKTHYLNIFKRVGIGKMTYLTFASGGTFSRYSHEFQTVTEAGEDTIYVCEECRVAVNAEIMGEQKTCPKCETEKLQEKKAIEVGNIFPLKTKYSDPFGLRYSDAQGRERPVIMGCYGIGLGRLMGAVVEVQHDELGITWPEEIAPFRIHLIEIKSEKPKIKSFTERLYKDLLAKGLEVLYDDRGDQTAGEKFSDADLIGIPWRVVVSEKTVGQNGVELKGRNAKKSEIISVTELTKRVKPKG